MERPAVSVNHKVVLDQRSKLELTGATEILRFEEDVVELNTCCGIMTVLGEDLRLKCLSLDDGAVMIQGKIQTIEYTDKRLRRGLFR